MDSGLDYLQYPPQSPCFGVTIGRKSDTLFLISLFISSSTSFPKVGQLVGALWLSQ